MEEYAGAQARYYDPYFRGVEGDVVFYVQAARDAGGPVLEVGCGTGRVLLPIARAGVEVVGLERAPALLAQARRKLSGVSARVARRVELVEGDLCGLELHRRFPLVLAPYRALQHLLTPVDQEQALRRIRRHLAPGGRLVFDVYDPLRELAAGLVVGDGQLRQDTDFIDQQTGNRVVVWYSRRFDPELQLLEQELLFEEQDAEGCVVGRSRGRLTLRYTFRYEMEYLLRRCGLAVEAVWGDFAGNPFPGWGNQVWVARRA
jgi:SAM-dependent methyltransferase